MAKIKNNDYVSVPFNYDDLVLVIAALREIQYAWNNGMLGGAQDVESIIARLTKIETEEFE